MALAYTVRDRLQHRWIRSVETFLKGSTRIVSYLSAEFLVGPQLANNLLNLGIYENVKEACESAGLDWGELLEQEPEPGLGNGGLGRLAACFLDSLSTLQIPAIGYGIELRIRHISPGDSLRLAGRIDGQMAVYGQPLGNRSSGRVLRGEISEDILNHTMTERVYTGSVGFRILQSVEWHTTRL